MVKFKKHIKCIFLSIIFIVSGCNDYQKLLNSEDNLAKYRAAENYYNEGEYRKANRLLEQVEPKYRGKPQAERVVFFLADSYFNTKRYLLAAYKFEDFTKSYPKSQRVQEALFLEAKSYYYESPEFSLDQGDTKTALDKLQIFINKFPQSEYLNEANVLVVELQTKLEKKDFEVSKQYYTIRDYKSAIKSLENFIAEYPGTSYREGAMYYEFLASYEIAINSVLNKQIERLEELIVLYNNILRYYPETIYTEDLTNKYNNINNVLESIQNTTTK
ncbi:MAG: outer membrane protein assembly factor BamD [Flavobacteriaceae bacterium]|nr:outer membrane protein assembly factor BamD [Flavobacteriaceae bacterium]